MQAGQAPALLEVKRLSPLEVRFRWEDGHEQVMSPAYLRRHCRCALCVNELTGERLLDPGSVPEDLAVTRIGLVGRYALQFEFGDHHATGIYPFPFLWKICPCGEHSGT